MSKLRKQNNEADKKREQAEMKREDDFQRLVTLRENVRAIDRYFGNTRFEGPAKDILDNDEGTVEDFIKALEEGLVRVKEDSKNMDRWPVSDRLGQQRMIAEAEQILVVAKQLQHKIRF